MTRDPKRIAGVLGALSRYWYANPDLRLGQIVGNCIPLEFNNDPFHVEDDVMLKGLLSSGCADKTTVHICVVCRTAINGALVDMEDDTEDSFAHKHCADYVFDSNAGCMEGSP